MGKVYNIYQVDSFTKELFKGNPAGVVSNADGLTELQMQQIARELNNSETAFIFSGNGTEYDVHVRFFTPKNEVPICGHATIAAHYVRAKELGLTSTRVYQKTGAGILPVDIVFDGCDYKIVMTQGEISIDKPLDQDYQLQLVKALGITAADLRTDCPIVIASTGHSKVMIGIKDSSLLHNLTPDMTALSELSRLINCNGYYVFTLHPDEQALVHGRMFAPAIGINEDPVTGNANGPLGAYLVHFGLLVTDKAEVSFTAVQGEAMGRAGKIFVKVKVADGKPTQVQLTGEALLVFKTQLEL